MIINSSATQALTALAAVGQGIRDYESGGWHGSKGYHSGLTKAAVLVDEKNAPLVAQLTAIIEAYEARLQCAEGLLEESATLLGEYGDSLISRGLADEGAKVLDFERKLRADSHA